MKTTIIDQTADWYRDVDVEKLEKKDTASNPRLGVGYVYKLKIEDEWVAERADKSHDYEVVLSPDGSEPVEVSQAKLSATLRATGVLYFKLFDVANVTRVLSAITDQSTS